MSRMGENQTERERNQKNSRETKMPMQSKSGILCTATCDRMVGGVSCSKKTDLSVCRVNP